MTYLKQFLKKEKEIRNAKIKHKEAIAQLATIVASADREVEELNRFLIKSQEVNRKLQEKLIEMEERDFVWFLIGAGAVLLAILTGILLHHLGLWLITL